MRNGHYCVNGACLAHHRAVYWNIQDQAWVHTDGWPCEASAGLSGPAEQVEEDR